MGTGVQIQTATQDDAQAILDVRIQHTYGTYSDLDEPHRHHLVQVWTSGLSQTYAHLEEDERRKWEAVFAKEAINAADPDKGDLGTRMLHHWRSRPGKSEFFVACDGTGCTQHYFEQHMNNPSRWQGGWVRGGEGRGQLAVAGCRQRGPTVYGVAPVCGFLSPQAGHCTQAHGCG